jgi:Ca2+-binding EF-hand superfamily protein
MNENSDNSQTLLRDRASELFKICDVEKKGFINRKDFLRLQDSIGESPDVLEDYFDSLDIDGNGFLTLNEFISAFSNIVDTADSGNLSDENQEDDVFRETMDSLGVPDNLIEEYFFSI